MVEGSLLGTVLVATAVSCVAALYAALGHGGASGYLAILSLLSYGSQAEMATTALVLNVLVAGIAWATFARGNRFYWKILWPFLLAALPGAFIGSFIYFRGPIYSVLLSGALATAAVRLIAPFTRGGAAEVYRPPVVGVALPVGFGIGLVSSALGVGGGIFLSPILLLARWADVRTTAAASAVFIVANSVVGLGGRFIGGGLEFGSLGVSLAAAFAGGVLGSYVGAKRLPVSALKRLLGVVLLAAAVKLVVGLFW